MSRRAFKRAAAGLTLLTALAALGYAGIRSREERQQRLLTQQRLDQQAAEITAHRRAQRAEPAPAPSAFPVKDAPPAPAAALRWTDFRGPRRDGHYTGQPVSIDWPATGLGPLWKQPVGAGHSSFVAAEGFAFTIEQRGADEVAAAYDVLTGREVWTNSWQAAFSETYGSAGPRATPTWHDGALFVLGATGELRSLDAATGHLRWRTNILEDAGASNLEWGMSASPLVVGDTVIVVPGGGNGRSVIAYDRRTGGRAWSALDDRAAYASPMAVRLAGIEQILLFTASRLVALSPDGARELWQFPWPTQNGINVAQPLVIGDNRVFVSSGYGTGAALIEVSRNDGHFDAREIWRTPRMKNQFTSSVHHAGFIYGLDEAILACLDAATGELKWKGGRYGYGQIMLASDHIVVVTEGGDLALVRATPERHVEIARFHGLEGTTWNHPAMAGGLLLVRNANEMAAFDLRAR